jgi:hypothetical protein
VPLSDPSRFRHTLQDVGARPVLSTARAAKDGAEATVRESSSDARDDEDGGGNDVDDDEDEDEDDDNDDDDDDDAPRDQRVVVLRARSHNQLGKGTLTFTFAELAAAAKARHGSAAMVPVSTAATAAGPAALEDTITHSANTPSLALGASKSIPLALQDRMPRRKPVRALRSP